MLAAAPDKSKQKKMEKSLEAFKKGVASRYVISLTHSLTQTDILSSLATTSIM